MKEIIYVALITFILKLFDNTFATIKNIQLQKEQFFYSSISNSLSTLFYFVAIAKAPKTDGMIILAAFSACIATFLGSYIPAKFMKKIEPEKMYVFEITSDTFENGIDFADKIRENNIPIKTGAVHDKDMNKVLNCKVYSQAKEESKLIKSIIPENFKYVVNLPVEY